MKSIGIGILGWLTAIVLVANLALILRPHVPVSAAPSQPSPEARIRILEARLQELEANAQTAGTFRRMSVSEHRRFEEQAAFANRVLSLYAQR